MPSRYATLTALALGVAGLSAASGAVICQGEDCVATQMGEDTFVAGGEVRIDAHLPGDALIAGGSVVVRGAIEGDVAAAGGEVEISSAIGQDLYAAGGEVELDGAVAGNARLAGGQVELGSQSRIGGGLSIGAGRAVLEGAIDGYVQGGAGELVINGRIDGDVDVGTEDLTLGPDARIGGQLRYRSSEEARIDPAAQVAGGIERLPADDDWFSYTPESVAPVARAAGIVWTVGAALLGVLILLAAPRFTDRTTALARTELGLVTVVGFAFIVAVPFAAVLLMITVLGIPLGIAVLLGYAVALFLGWLFAVIAAGDRLLDALGRGGTDRSGPRVLAFLGALIALALLGQLPWIGGLIRLAVVVIGTGAFVLALWRGRRPAAPAVSPA
ncbi:MAG TPA: polymer-forming cytoskeletal protein [Steroidobacteraceae bacterium]|nr:polymer-forming cytoskeletal protein [Steroidobacteraceae bacterium]